MPWKQRIAMAAFGRSEGLNERLFDEVYAGLSPLHQQILQLYFVGNVPMGRITTLLQMSTKVVNKHMKEALNAFKVSGMIKELSVRPKSSPKTKTRYYPRAEYKDEIGFRIIRKREHYSTPEEAAYLGVKITPSAEALFMNILPSLFLISPDVRKPPRPGMIFPFTGPPTPWYNLFNQ